MYTRGGVVLGLFLSLADVPVWAEDDLGGMADGRRRGGGDQARGGGGARRGRHQQVGDTVMFMPWLLANANRERSV